MFDLKQVKVDNWGIYFLQRLKHFFNRTDYCDLTLQFQDNAQLKVHRLVLSACTEYFELLERTCEMYEDCLVMPDDLQAEVVVPIVNFMYTGQLEFKVDLLEKLYQTSQIMNMPVLTKLLDAQRNQLLPKPAPTHSYSGMKRYTKIIDTNKQVKQPTSVPSSSNATNKRSYTKAFESNNAVIRDKKLYQPAKKLSTVTYADNGVPYHPPSPIPLDPVVSSKKLTLSTGPTRYELPEELDLDSVFENSFTNISYTSKPLMVHPETTKHYSSKKNSIFSDASNSKKFIRSPPTTDIVECKKIAKDDNIFDDDASGSLSDETEMFSTTVLNVKNDSPKDASQLFDQILDSNDSPKVTIETKDSKQVNNIDHAKIISEVLKKYPHLVKSNKNIKLKILNTSNKNKKHRPSTPYVEDKEIQIKNEVPDFTYETDVLNSKEAAKLIAMGAANIKGPWICLICGTPGKALHFTSYYKFRRHLVEVHNEKPLSSVCEYCGLKSLKRNYLLHHIYTKHGVEPPPPYHFPKCNLCNYIALTEGLLVKHKMSHTDVRIFRCNVCSSTFNTSNQLLIHIQNTGHKYSAQRKTNLQCIYCLKVFLRQTNLYAHLKTNHKEAAKNDGIIDDSDEEKQEQLTYKPEIMKSNSVKCEPSSFESEYEDLNIQYQIQQRPDGNIQLISKKPRILATTPKQKILNPGFNTSKITHKTKTTRNVPNMRNEYLEDVNISSPNTSYNEEIVVIGDTEYIMRDNQLIPRKGKTGTSDEYIISNVLHSETEQQLQTITPSTSIEFTNLHNIKTEEAVQQPKMIIKKTSNINQPIQIVVSNEEEYKALMASNHSIIFDDGDTNKTLTVLTAPHTTSLDATTIDLDNTQSNDMMIIQDDYPLNVSEAVPTDNSNIVVVYSHPVDDQNKQYQLITSQGIGAQFVQPSTVITQNYETVTTSAPIMTAQVIGTQADETWQSNLQQSIETQQIQLASETELQGIPVAEQTELTHTNDTTDTTLVELPEVQLISDDQQIMPTQVTEVNEIAETLSQSNVMNTEVVNLNVEQTVEEEMQNVSSTPMDVDIPSETIIEKNINELQDKDKQNELIPQDVSDINEVNSTIVENETEEAIAEPVVAEQTPDKSELSEEAINIVNNDDSQKSETTVNIPDSIHNDVETDNDKKDSDMAEIIPVSNEEVTFTKPATKEQIQNLTSEWSEDEDEITQEQNDVIDVNENTSTVKLTVNECLDTENSVEIEESIENIQQEMNKQMSGIIEAETEIANSPHEDNLSSLRESDEPQPSSVQAANTNPEASQERISSLLNEWEENDSQEENTSLNENENDIPSANEVVENINTVNEENTIEEKQDMKKEDNIKSLVSDWDDDEEEYKD